MADVSGSRCPHTHLWSSHGQHGIGSSVTDLDSSDQNEDSTLPDFGDSVDIQTFSQILEMDEDETEREFSKPLVLNFFEQAEETFDKMDKAL